MKKLFNQCYIYILYLLILITCLLMIKDYKLIEIDINQMIALSIFCSVSCYLAIIYKKKTFNFFHMKISIPFLVHFICLCIVVMLSTPFFNLLQTFIDNPILWENFNKLLLIYYLFNFLLYLVIRISFFLINQNLIGANYFFIFIFLGFLLYFKRYNTLLISIIAIVIIISLLTKKGTTSFPHIKKGVIIQITIITLFTSLFVKEYIPLNYGYVDFLGNLSSLILKPTTQVIRAIPFDQERKVSMLKSLTDLNRITSPTDRELFVNKNAINKDQLNQNTEKENSNNDLPNNEIKPTINGGLLTNKKLILSDENPVIIELGIPYNLNYLKASSYVTYDSNRSSFTRNYSEEMDRTIDKINKLLPLSVNFENIFLRTDLVDKDNVYVKNINAPTHVYVPYGLIQTEEDTSMFQDLYYNFVNPNSYLEYSMMIDTDSNFMASFSKPEVISLYKQTLYNECRQVPNEIAIQLKKFLLDRGIDYTSADKFTLIEQIKELLINNYEYSLDPGPLPEDKDFVLYFLLENNKGNYQHFAASATLLFRVCGIPTRYVEGYLIENDNQGNGVVKENYIHAWPEIYRDSKGWGPIEVTNRSDYINEPTYSDSDDSLTDNSPITPDNEEEIADLKNDIDNIENTEYSASKAKANNSNDLKYIVLLFLTICIGGGIFYYLRSKKVKPEVTLLSKTYDAYDLLQKYNFLNDEINTIMYRIRYSTHGVTENDYDILMERIKELEIYISKNYKLIKKLKARYIDHLKV
ncbi:MAG: transglutaminase-like domain-containing protein [Erysipelotrichaceae bacterium]